MKILMFSLFMIIFGLGTAFGDPASTEASSEIKTHFVDEQIMIVSDISNNQDIQQNFAYITKVSNDNNVIISLSWLTGSLSPKQSFFPAQSWIPTESGTYHIQVFVWASIDNPESLSPPLSMIVSIVDMQS
ncbi:MAG: hypothetical protein OEM28_09820 [Nitrosopumilus sp.]|nr:hypothetical protein [Nitrosopumilus sp.]